MERTMTEEELNEIASQLSYPQGENGIKVAEVMNENNIGMTRAAIHALMIEQGNKLLEIGHGNCGHLLEILAQAENISYSGLEISQTMHEEAKRLNAKLATQNEVSFHLYEGNQLPFPDQSFDRILTVNTIYFWPAPEAFLQEIYRALKQESYCAIAYGHKDFMDKLPFVNERFRLFNREDVETLVNSTEFEIVRHEGKSDQVLNKVLEPVNRMYSVAVLKK